MPGVLLHLHDSTRTSNGSDLQLAHILLVSPAGSSRVVSWIQSYFPSGAGLIVSNNHNEQVNNNYMLESSKAEGSPSKHCVYPLTSSLTLHTWMRLVVACPLTLRPRSSESSTVCLTDPQSYQLDRCCVSVMFFYLNEKKFHQDLGPPRKKDFYTLFYFYKAFICGNLG